MNETAQVSNPPPLWLRLALNPYLLILATALLDTSGEVFFRIGANGAPNLLHAVFNLWTWIGIVSYVGGLLVWLYVLRSVPLSIAFPMLSVVHVLVPLASRQFLHETVPLRRWIGIALIVAGLLAILQPLARAEEKL